MDFFNQTYNALRGPQGAPQTPADTIGKLADRLSPSTLLADRRAAVLALKGLSREWKAEVGENTLPGLLFVLETDADIDADIAKAALDTLNILCEAGENPTPASRSLALVHTDKLLANDQAVNKLFALLSDANFYTRFYAVQLLATLLQNRRQVVQGYFLKAAEGPRGVLPMLEEKREILRNEALVLVQSLINQSPDIQKLLAFEGAFDKLFNIIRQENGVDGGLVVHDCLSCVEGLLRFNVSNHTFFRETGYPGVLLSLIYYPVNLPPQESAPQEFALQFWDSQKANNVRMVISILGMLVGSKSPNEAETRQFVRCLTEFGLASNAPTSLKSLALRLLPTNYTFPLLNHILTPYIPVPETNGEEWDRLEATSAFTVLVEVVTKGEYSGVEGEKQTVKESLELRTAAASVFQNYVRREDVCLAILQGLIPSSEAPPPVHAIALLESLIRPPSTPLNEHYVLGTVLSAHIFSNLLRSSRCKQVAQECKPTTIVPPDLQNGGGGSFFVPADNSNATPPPPTPPQPEAAVDDEDGPQSLLQILAEHLSLSFVMRSRAVSSESDGSASVRHWDRLILAYIPLLSQWLWDDPKAVREYLENGGLGVLVEPVNQTSDMDAVVQGLCAFLLGICYEYNREPGEITRSTIHAILNRLGIDMLVGRMSRVKDDERVKTISPEDILVHASQLPYGSPGTNGSEDKDVLEIWFDWAFVDFWKSNYYTVQRALALDPDTLSSSGGGGEQAESAMLIASLREVIRNQANDMDALKAKISHLEQAKDAEISRLTADLEAAKAELAETVQKKTEVEKEQEDLLVFLEEVSTKRKRDKERLREASLEVSEDEDGGDDDEDGDAEEDD